MLVFPSANYCGNSLVLDVVGKLLLRMKRDKMSIAFQTCLRLAMAIGIMLAYLAFKKIK